MMQKCKVLSVFGTRPEAIKMCPLIRELEKREEIESIVCVTGQHRQMLDQVLELFAVKPDFDLELMKERQTLTTITTGVLEKLEDILKSTAPDIVLVHGDTTTSASAALAAFYQRIPVGHVEAGLRTFDNYSPYPEEMNRKIISQIAELNFAPTERNRQNLINENIHRKICVTGNTVIDAFQYTVQAYYLGDERIDGIEHNYVAEYEELGRTVFWRSSYELGELLDGSASAGKQGYSIDCLHYKKMI